MPAMFPLQVVYVLCRCRCPWKPSMVVVFFFCSLLSLFAPKAVVLSLAAFVFYCRYRELSTKRREAFLT